jgi:hypothetical protein
MCCECENNSGNFTYVAFATDLNGSNFSLSRNSNGISRCYQAIYVSAVELDTNLSIFPNYFYGRYYNICAAKETNNYHLPTPMIAKRKVTLEKETSRLNLDGISTRKYQSEDLAKFDFGNRYYLEQLDIYFNSFGKENSWLSLPDKRLELCLVSNKNYKNGGRPGTTTSDIIFSGVGNKDNFTNAIVHPANSSKENPTITDTIFSGGTVGEPFFKTEWKINENDFSFGESIFNASGLNRFNNPNITIELDVRNFILRGHSNAWSYPYNIRENGDIKIRNIGKIRFANGKYYKRNSVLYFRLSAGMPSTLNQKTGVYQKRIYSDLSIPIYISPKIGIFTSRNTGDQLGFLYGHRLTLGIKK